MIHSKFRDDQTSSSREDKRAFNILGHDGHLGHVTKIFS